MKSLIVLAAVIVVARAGFTGSLLQEVEPLLQTAHAESQLALQSSSARGGFMSLVQSQLVNVLQINAQNIVSQIEAAIEQGQQVAHNMAAHIQSALQQLQALGADLAQYGQTVLHNLLGNLLQEKEKEKNGFARARQLVVNLHFPALLIASLQQLFHGVLSEEQISALSDYIHQLTSNSFPQSRGIISGLSNLGDLLSTLIGLASSTASNTYTAVYTLVAQFLDTSASLGQYAVEAAAEQLLSFIRPFKWILGKIYDQVETAINSILGRPQPEI